MQKKDSTDIEQETYRRTRDALEALTEAHNHTGGSVDEAMLFYSVMREKYNTVGNGDGLPESARLFVQDFLRALCEEMDIYAWNDYLLAPILWMIYEGCVQAGAGAAFPIIHAGIKALCTRQEYADFCENEGIPTGSDAPLPMGDYMAASLAARLIADQRTPDELRRRLEDAIDDLTNHLGVRVYHPALVERVLTVAFEATSGPATGDNAEMYERDRKEY